ncbi:MBL fold metallo-hydrolase [Candidatus Gottesmanbacteria bacterium]|nr:MBL fold metallo-hydrolase [Candidatus Gottesmanbacteria bacterium]
MEIHPLGHSSFRLRGKQATVVTDPYDAKEMSVKFPKHIEADVVTISHDHSDHNAAALVEGKPYVIKGPGEYEIKGISVIGIASFHDEQEGKERGRNTMYRIEVDNVKIAHLGDIGHVLSSVQLDALDGVDVLLIPVGGTYTVDAEKAAQIISDIEPKIVIPMHDARSNKDLAPLEAFLKKMNKTDAVPVPKLTISRDKLPAVMEVVVLE